MPSVDLESHLARRTQSTTNAAVHATLHATLHTTMAIATRDTRLTAFAINDHGVTFDSTLDADVTFFFDSAETALAVLSGTEDPFAAFLEGRFRSDGHLPLAFVLLGLFRSGVDTTPPP